MLSALSATARGMPKTKTTMMTTAHATVTVHHWGSAACCNKRCQLAAVSTAVSGEQQGFTFTGMILSPDSASLKSGLATPTPHDSISIFYSIRKEKNVTTVATAVMGDRMTGQEMIYVSNLSYV